MCAAITGEGTDCNVLTDGTGSVRHGHVEGDRHVDVSGGGGAGYGNLVKINECGDSFRMRFGWLERAGRKYQGLGIGALAHVRLRGRGIGGSGDGGC
jgi:hypothetical protein